MADPGIIPPPYALALGVCDLLYRDPGTGKRFILGCFGAVHAVDFPAVHPSLAIYLDLTNGRGSVTVKVQLVDCDEVREPVFVTESQVEFSDVRLIAELDFIIGGISFPEPGEYRIQVFADNGFVIERRLLVNKIATQP